MTEVPEYILKAASMAAFPGLPNDMSLDEANRRVEAALRAAWPLIEWHVRAEAACQLTGLTLDQIEIAAGLRHGPVAAGKAPDARERLASLPDATVTLSGTIEPLPEDRRDD